MAMEIVHNVKPVAFIWDDYNQYWMCDSLQVPKDFQNTDNSPLSPTVGVFAQ